MSASLLFWYEVLRRVGRFYDFHTFGGTSRQSKEDVGYIFGALSAKEARSKGTEAAFLTLLLCGAGGLFAIRQRWPFVL